MFSSLIFAVATAAFSKSAYAAPAPNALLPRDGNCACDTAASILVKVKADVDACLAELKAKSEIDVAICVAIILKLVAIINVAIGQLHAVVKVEADVNLVIKLCIDLILSIVAVLEICLKVVAVVDLKLVIGQLSVVIEALIAVCIQICVKVDVQIQARLCAAIQANVELIAKLKACVIIDIFVKLGIHL